MKKIMNTLFGVVFILSLSGCATGSVFSGKSATRFQADVSRVYEVSLKVLEEENMPIVSKSFSKDKAQIKSQYPNGIPLSIVIRTTSLQYVETNVVVGSSGSDYRAYELLKEIESRVK